MKEVLEHVEKGRQKALEELKEFLRFPSVSADPAYRQKTLACAEFVKDRLQSIGFKTNLLPTPGLPVVYGEWMEAKGAKTLLIYGHYDVQPPDPLDLWQSPPFKPEIRDGYLFARGVHDNKGQHFAHLKASEAFLKTKGRLPLNVKFFIEGEEEVGSPHMEEFLRAKKDLLRADYAAVSDSSLFDDGVPAILYGLRGIAFLEVVLTGPSHDLHSGGYGGTIANPAQVLTKLLDGLKNPSGRVTLPGFYDDVIPPSDWEREIFAKLPFDEEAYLQTTGSPKLSGEEGFTTLERRWARPTLEVNGLYGGYAGSGVKTIIPSQAGAKVSMRLVPNQDPEKVSQLFEDYVRQNCPETVQVEVRRHGGGKPVLLDPKSPAMAAAGRAVEKGFGKVPVLIREGGSIPVVATIKEILGLESLLIGFGGPDDRIHSPNERLAIENFYRGTLTAAHLLNELAS